MEQVVTEQSTYSVLGEEAGNNNKQLLVMDNYGKNKLVIMPSDMDVKKRYAKYFNGIARWNSSLKNAKGAGWVISKSNQDLASSILQKINNGDFEKVSTRGNNRGGIPVVSDMSTYSTVAAESQVSQVSKVSNASKASSTVKKPVPPQKLTRNNLDKIREEENNNEMIQKLEELKSQSKNRYNQKKFRRSDSEYDSDSSVSSRSGYGSPRRSRKLSRDRYRKMDRTPPRSKRYSDSESESDYSSDSRSSSPDRHILDTRVKDLQHRMKKLELKVSKRD